MGRYARQVKVVRKTGKGGAQDGQRWCARRVKVVLVGHRLRKMQGWAGQAGQWVGCHGRVNRQGCGGRQAQTAAVGRLRQ
jgi:hypothetical protein